MSSTILPFLKNGDGSMNITRYNKLIRDRIPEIIQASGKACVTEILSDADYLKMVDAKLDE